MLQDKVPGMAYFLGRSGTAGVPRVWIAKVVTGQLCHRVGDL